MSNDVKDAIDPTLSLARSHVVEVHLPAKVGFDLEQFQEIQRRVFDRLGHTMCVSGFDIRWKFEQRFLVDDDLGLRPF
jgi:hypothetical protein